jgi:hypothetical protein
LPLETYETLRRPRIARTRFEMDDYFAVTILDGVCPETIPQKDMPERVFRRQSVERGVGINELIGQPIYSTRRYES